MLRRFRRESGSRTPPARVLTAEDEAAAANLIPLVEQWEAAVDANDKEGWETAIAQARVVGETLCARGGIELMRAVADRVGQLEGTGRLRELEGFWGGICGWMR